MIQNFITKHTTRRNLFPFFYGDYANVAAPSVSLDPHSSIAHAHLDSGKMMYVSTTIDEYWSTSVPVAVSVGAALSPLDPAVPSSALVVGFSQLVNAGVTVPDFKKPISIYPLEMSGNAHGATVKDVFSVYSSPEAGKVVLAGVAVFSLSGSYSALLDTTSIFTDGPVYQPNK